MAEIVAEEKLPIFVSLSTPNLKTHSAHLPIVRIAMTKKIIPILSYTPLKAIHVRALFAAHDELPDLSAQGPSMCAHIFVANLPIHTYIFVCVCVCVVCVCVLYHVPMHHISTQKQSPRAHTATQTNTAHTHIHTHTYRHVLHQFSAFLHTRIRKVHNT